jgi:uncharacterized membrane protein
MADATEDVKEQVTGENGAGGLASKDKIVPALATAAAAAAAGLAATKGPDLLKKLQGTADNQAEEMGEKAVEGAKESMGSSGGLMGKAASKLMGGGGGDDKGQSGGGKTRRLPIQRWTDVAVPVDRAYEAWTQWEEWPNFMHRVLEAEPNEDEDNQIHVREKIWFWTREWDGEITEQKKNDRIAWKTTKGMKHSGVVSFHKLDDNLTRVMVDMDFVPQGVVEKMASGMRFVKRAVQADLARFKAYVEFAQIDGIEYKSSPEEMEQNQGSGDDENGDEQGDRQDAQASSSEESSDDGGEENGRRSSDEERQERERRREERRKAASSS